MDSLASDCYVEEEYDVCIIYHTNDRKDVHAFKELLERIIPTNPRITLIENFGFSAGKLQHLEMMIDKSTFIFVYVTDEFLSDEYCKMYRDELIMSTCEDYENRWKLVPVLPSKPKLRIPLGLKALNSLSLSRLNYLNDIASSLKSLKLDNIHHYDRYFATNMQKLFDRAKLLREKREEKLIQKCKEDDDWSTAGNVDSASEGGQVWA